MALVSAEPPVELFASERPPPRWRARWAALPRGGRVLAGGLVVLLVLAAGVVWFRDWSAERDRRQRVELTTSIGVWASSSSRPEGEINYFLRVRNDGALPLSLTGADGAGGGVRLLLRDGAARQLGPGEEAVFPLSVRLTCDGEVGGGGAGADDGLPTEFAVRREDGESVVRQVDLQPAGPLLEVAAMLCEVRPALRDHELSGPVLRIGE